MPTSLVELCVAAGLAAALGATGLFQLLGSIDDSRALGAARYLTSRLQRARIEAVRQNAASALRFTKAADGAYEFTAIVDGNRNGVLSSDIQSGEDRAISPTERLSDR